jgi:hypothetical protein
MSLVFAMNWDKYDDQALTVDGACKLIRAALTKPEGMGIGNAIDGFAKYTDNRVRVINGLHRSKADTHLHMTVHSVALHRTYHLWISKNGNLSKVSYETAAANAKPGHVNDLETPYFQNLPDFTTKYPL